jgi:lincosamide nucleotidyltransferase A/C/D/E
VYTNETEERWVSNLRGTDKDRLSDKSRNNEPVVHADRWRNPVGKVFSRVFKIVARSPLNRFPHEFIVEWVMTAEPDFLLRRVLRSALASLRGQMDASEILRLEAAFSSEGLEVLLIGGWGVDALVGSQTRMHEDADFALENYEHDEPIARRMLIRLGYTHLEISDASEDPYHWMPKISRFQDGAGHRIELVGILWDRVAAMGALRDEELGTDDADELRSMAHVTGEIGGQTVPCLAIPFQRAFHIPGPGYIEENVTSNHRRDLSMLSGDARLKNLVDRLQ